MRRKRAGLHTESGIISATGDRPMTNSAAAPYDRAIGLLVITMVGPGSYWGAVENVTRGFA